MIGRKLDAMPWAETAVLVGIWLALAAYAAYVLNAAQFILKLRTGRLDEARGTSEVTA